jgi:hypothetical protein
MMPGGGMQRPPGVQQFNPAPGPPPSKVGRTAHRQLLPSSSIPLPLVIMAGLCVYCHCLL